jgi:hypothetical protein
MTFWQSFTFNRSIHVDRLFQGVQELLKRVGPYLSQVHDRLTESYPKSYLGFVIRSQVIVISRFVDDVLVEQKTFHFAEETQNALSNYLQQHADLPLHIIFQGGEADFRLASLKHVRFFDRPSLLRQIKMGEFSHHHWTLKLYSPTQDDRYRYLLAGVRPTQILKNVLEFVLAQPNPIAGVHLWPILLAQQVLFENPTANKWVFILHKQDDDFWHLVVCQNGAVVMYRHGFFDNLKKIDQQLSKEVVATLRYLNRNGFQEGDDITILQSNIPPLSLPSDVHADIVTLDTPIVPYAPLLKRWNLRTFLGELIFKIFGSRFANNLPQKQGSLNLSAFLPQRLAYVLPQVLTQILPPFVLFFIMAGALFFVKSHSQQGALNTLNEQIQKLTLTDADQKNLANARLFHYYKAHLPTNPALILKTLSKHLTASAVVTDIKWAPTTLPDLPFSLKVKISFDEASLTKVKKGAKMSSLETLQNKISQTIQKEFKTAHIQWQPTNQKNAYTLNISYGHDPS